MIAIAGGKGGSGKTTTAVGLAMVMARQGADPIIVDCDPDMPDLHHLLGIDRRDGIDGLAGGVSIERACQRSTLAPGVRCLTAGDRSNVDHALARVTEWHGPVVLDCPPGTGPDAVCPLRHAGQAIVVTTDQPESLSDARRTARTARELDTRVTGALCRMINAETDAVWRDESPILARVESVESPLEHPQVRAAWRQAVNRLTRSRAAPSRGR